LIVADIVDEDRFIHERPSKLSSLIFGANAFFTKPGQSLAPMFGWLVLDDNYRAQTVGNAAHQSLLHSSMFNILCLVPACCAAVQLLLWYFYTLHGTYVAIVRTEKHPKQTV